MLLIEILTFWGDFYLKKMKIRFVFYLLKNVKWLTLVLPLIFEHKGGSDRLKIYMRTSVLLLPSCTWLVWKSVTFSESYPSPVN